VPAFLRRGRCWGITCQLYGLRSERNWGIGDFEDLARLAEIVAAAGGDFLGVNPLHALYPADPERCSPIRPPAGGSSTCSTSPPTSSRSSPASSRPASMRCAQRPGRLWRGRATKLAALEAMFRGVPGRSPAGSPQRLRGFSGAAGARRWSAIACSRRCTSITPARRGGTGRRRYRRVDSEAVSRFRASHAGRITFFAWLQWLADRQLKAAQARARAAGMRIGLYLDMAVGVAPDGAMAWADPSLMVRGVHIGAPPDAFNLQGQDWGLIPQRPTVLIERHFEPFRDDLRASMHMPARCASTMPWRSSACSGSRPVRRPSRAPMCAIRWPPCWPPSPRNRAIGAARRRRGARHRAGGLLAAAGRQGTPVLPGAVLRAPPRRRLPAPAQLSEPRARLRLDPRPADRCSAGGPAATSSGASTSGS
jgi:hypothetical protein